MEIAFYRNLYKFGNNFFNMDSRKFMSKKRYLLAFIMGTLAFLLIFLISYSISFIELQRISNLQSDSSYDIFKDKLYYSFFNESSCFSEGFDKLSEDLNFQGRIIDDLEIRLGKNDESVLNRKKFYTIVQLEHLEFVNLLNERCNGQVNTILFFYSNNDSKIDVSEESGRILSVVGSRVENLMIYSFDVDLDSELVDKLEEKYNITEIPVAVINEKTQIELPARILDIEKYLY